MPALLRVLTDHACIKLTGACIPKENHIGKNMRSLNDRWGRKRMAGDARRASRMACTTASSGDLHSHRELVSQLRV